MNKLKCYITPSTMFMPGHAERVLGDLGAGPLAYDKLGRIVAHLTQGQIDVWGIKGPQHRLELAPVDLAPAPVPAAIVEPESEPFVPSITIETVPGGERKTVAIDTHGVPPALQADTSKMEPSA